MIPIKNILEETGVKEIFRLIVPSGNYAGTYEIEKPSGWDDVNSVINVDEELFFVKDFIIGNDTKLKFTEYGHENAFKILKKVYQEQGGDGVVNFKWIAVKNEVEYDLLRNQFDVNMNKYVLSFDTSMYKIEIELIKSEAANKFFNREETTVDLFADKDLDENDIDPVQTFNIGYKKGAKSLSNFYTYDISQYRFGAAVPGYKFGFFSFKRSDDFEFGDNLNGYASFTNYDGLLGARKYQGDFISTNISIPNIKVEISNLEIEVNKGSGIMANASLYALVKNGVVGVREKKLANTDNGIIKIDNKIFDIGNLNPGENLTFEIRTNEDVNIGMYPIKENTSIQLTTNLESPLVKTKGVRLLNALNQITKNYSSSELSVISNYLGENGIYYNTSISTGVYLRGLPQVYVNQKIKTSFKKIMNEGAAKLLGLGFDILENDVVIEDFTYFFKDFKCFDLSDKLYLRDGFKIENDKDLVFNVLTFGSKKYSTEVKDDIRNFTTAAEFSTPIKTIKNKFEKETDLIIDEFKIQELIEDKSSSTNNNDDDLVLIDMVNVSELWDTGVFKNCVHSIDGGQLMLNCVETPFDTTMIEVGNLIQIKEGINAGQWNVVSIQTSKMKLSGSTTIQTGVNDTPIKYKITSLIKNRTNDGFTAWQNIRNPETATNIRHNPKYQMARWFPYFGSGLRKKGNSELIKVTNYKNNSDAQIKTNSNDLINELPDLVTVGADETLGRLRSAYQTLFNGDVISISYCNVTFEEFFNLYSSWKFGEGNDRLKSRGYISLNTPEGIFDAFPFGDSAFAHDRKTNVLTINAKLKSKSVDNPTLLSVVQSDKDTVVLEWSYNSDYINPLIKIQYSLDGINWTTLKEVENVTTATVDSNLFLSIFTGTNVNFRIVVSTADYYNKISNTIQIVWQFNNWIFREINRSTDNGCGISYLSFELSGTGNFEIDWNFISRPGGSTANVIDNNSDQIVNFFTDYGADWYETKTTNHSLNNESKTFFLQTTTTDNDGVNYLNCNTGQNFVIVRSEMDIQIKDLDSGEIVIVNLAVRAVKRYNPPFTPGGPFDPSTDPF